MRLTELGRAARAASGVNLRQPLGEVLVRVRTEAELAGVKALQDQLRDELNVKAVRFLDVQDDFVDYVIKPNLPRLGKRLGRLLPELRRQLETMDGRKVAADVRDGRATTLVLDGTEVVLEPEDLLLDARSPAGYAAEEARGYLAALNTTVTPELQREGAVRDVVRLVQNARKNAGLEVSDRIRLALGSDGGLAEALAEHAEALKSEVLATSIELVSAPGEADGERWTGSHRERHQVAGQPLSIELVRA